LAFTAIVVGAEANVFNGEIMSNYRMSLTTRPVWWDIVDVDVVGCLDHA